MAGHSYAGVKYGVLPTRYYRTYGIKHGEQVRPRNFAHPSRGRGGKPESPPGGCKVLWSRQTASRSTPKRGAAQGPPHSVVQKKSFSANCTCRSVLSVENTWPKVGSVNVESGIPKTGVFKELNASTLN